MSKVLAVIKREYLFRVRKKSFVVLTLLGPLLMVLVYSLPLLFFSMSSGGERRIALADLSGTMSESLKAELAGRKRLVQTEPGAEGGRGFSLDRSRFELVDATQPDEGIDQARQRLNAALAGDAFDAYLILGPDPDAEGNFIYGSRSSADIPRSLVRALTNVVVGERSRRLGLELDAGQLAELTRPAEVTPVRVSKSGEEVSEGDVQQAVAKGLVWGMSFIFYLTFLLWGSTIIQGVVEEKGSRIVEVLLSSVTSTQFMVGKVTGIAAVALTQLLVWVICAVVVVVSGTTVLPQIADVLHAVDLGLFGWFLLMFLTGFAIYSLLYAAVGAMVNSNQEAQQAAMPVTFMVIIAFFLIFAVGEAPDSGLAVFGSLFPFTSPLVLLMRLGVTEPPLWQVALALALQGAAIVGVAWGAARVFRMGILMTGKRLTLPEIVRAVRAGG